MSSFLETNAIFEKELDFKQVGAIKRKRFLLVNLSQKNGRTNIAK